MPSIDPTPPDASVCEGCGVQLAAPRTGRRCPRCESALGPRPLADVLFLAALAVAGTLLVTAATFSMTEVSGQPAEGATPHGNALVTAWRRPAVP
jgi:hypothetical protein